MKTLFLVPPAMNVECIVKSFPFSEIDTLFLPALQLGAPVGWDLVVYTGATDGQYCLPIDKLKELKSEGAKTLFISTAGGDPFWHPLMKQYAEENVFDLVVNIDGNKNWPRRPQDLDLIGCVDPLPYHNIPDKDVMLGTNFGSHPARDNFIWRLAGLVKMGPRSESYGHNQTYADFMKRCKYWLNVNWTSEDEIIKHVNMKVIEAGLAGCILLEKKGSLVNQYFTPGVDYLEYETVDDIKYILAQDDHSKIAWNLSEKVRIQYSNTQFWTQILSALSFHT